MSLEALRALSISIITSSISHPLGMAKLPSSTESVVTPKEQQLLDLQAELDTLSRKIVEARESTGLPERRTMLGERSLLQVVVYLGKQEYQSRRCWRRLRPRRTITSKFVRITRTRMSFLRGMALEIKVDSVYYA